MNEHDVTALKTLLKEPRKIVITTHRKPDGDAMGSSLGLAHYLRNIGHNVTVVVPTTYPHNLHWLPGNDDVITYGKNKEEALETIFHTADIAFCLDLSVPQQMPNIYPLFEQSSAVKVLVDHHQGPEIQTDLTFWDTSAAATAQIIFQLIMTMDGIDGFTPDIANCLYAGLMTDTGRFKHPNTTIDVFKTATALIEAGANNVLVSRNIYDNNTVNGLQFLGFVLSQRLVIIKEYNTAYFYISPKDFADYKTTINDTEDLVNYALSLGDIQFAVQMTDLGSKIKLSFRSKGAFSVSRFAAKHYDGGGHHNASGGSSLKSLEETRAEFEALLPQYKEALTS